MKQFYFFLVLVLFGVEGLLAQPKPAVRIDGSSTVYPVSHAISDLYNKIYKQYHVQVEISGTTGGMKKFIQGATDINNSSRELTFEEHAQLSQNGIPLVEIPIATDGISLVVHKRNTFVESLTVQQLREMWKKGSSITFWSDLNPSYPKTLIRFYGPGEDSGTRDYFEEAIFGNTENQLREDMQTFEDDEIMEKRLASDVNGIGIIGLAYLHMFDRELNGVAIDNGNGPVYPSYVNVKNGEYKPLSRSLYLHINEHSLPRPEVQSFLSFYMRVAQKVIQTAGYIPFTNEYYREKLSQLMIPDQKVLPR